MCDAASRVSQVSAFGQGPSRACTHNRGDFGVSASGLDTVALVFQRGSINPPTPQWNPHFSTSSLKLGASLLAQLVKNLPAMWQTWVRSLGWEDPLEKEKATHTSILAWRILWTV